MRAPHLHAHRIPEGRLPALLRPYLLKRSRSAIEISFV
jgi:hypothetical protein